MDSYFHRKVFTITGGSSGMGLETARQLLLRGAFVSLADVSENLESTAAALRKEIPTAKILTTTLDVRDEQAVANWIIDTEAKLGKIHGGLNAAGLVSPSHFVQRIDETPLDDWHLTIGVNLTGVMLCMRELVRAMKNSKTQGSIVNITSAAGIVGYENGGPYSASKWGVIGLTRSVAKETASIGIRVTGVAP
jgi:NAD(P)-dependent dehydrogenase (short-subunit alcohol dehydrogenase family)